ncbi:DUF3466 family protein [Shewanella cyperi]|uniref:DUF3466 family protein n=1 Tax=Shewanella cyperi TaxID=2814292 RepID=UPI001A95302A|nr:DUF3466 family protein [Shewanella cyperi]QSX39336.1 DUF3466 family protein [Shewanella cyperi]
MKLKLDKALTLVALSVAGVLGTAQAAPVYEVVNIEDFDLNGTIEGTRNGYAMGINANNELVGVAQGRKKLNSSDVEGGIIDADDGVADAEKITYSVNSPIVANNFSFVAGANGEAGAWIPTFESLGGTTDPALTDTDVPESINSVDTYYYDINDAGIKVGALTAPEKKVDYTGSSTTQEFWYYRDFEQRAVVKTPGGEIELPPPYTTYTNEGKTVELGGMSLASAINNNNQVTGYASTALSSFSSDRVAACITADEAGTGLPLDICVQQEQYPSGSQNTRNIQYQNRAFVWQLGEDTVTEMELPLGLEPPADSKVVYSAQGLGINNEGDVAGRSHIFRDNDTKKLRLDAAYWRKNADGQYEYHWVPVINKDVTSSIAFDINDNGILVGSYRSYIQGVLRDKFFYFDTKADAGSVVVPNDFSTSLTDLSSKPRDINNQGQVVGFIETEYDKDKPRPKAGFLFDMNSAEFVNLNAQLTCQSKGFEQGTDGNWQRHKVEVQDGTGKTLSYETDIQIVEANSINEAGLIVGTAFVRKPVYQTDLYGIPVVGENGLPLFSLDGNGNPVTSYLPRMVVLAPAASGAEACDAVDGGTETKYERKGAAGGLLALLLLPFAWIRRRIR